MHQKTLLAPTLEVENGSSELGYGGDESDLTAKPITDGVGDLMST